MKINWKQTLLVRYFGLMKIPLIFFVRPKIHVLNNEQCALSIPLRRRTRNHLKSLYFGTLAIGADLASGLLAMEMIRRSDHRISLVFKSMEANFLKRVDGDALFTCKEGDKIQTLVQKVIDSGERQHEPINIEVTSPEKYGDEILAQFTLVLSLKQKGV